MRRARSPQNAKDEQPAATGRRYDNRRRRGSAPSCGSIAMSHRQQFAYAAMDAGLHVEENLATWVGSVEDCWNQYVEPHATATNPRFGCDVYWLEAVVGETGFWKIGISNNANRRLGQLRDSFPVAEWRVVKVARVATKRDAERCETDMLVACRRLHVAGEWLARQ